MGQATTDTPGRETGTPAESFPGFYRRHSGDLYVYFARRVIDVEVARDLTAETFAQAFEHRHRRHGRRDPDAIAWLYGIARHQLSRYWRRGRAERRAIRRLGIQLGDIADDDLDRAVALADLDALRGAVASALERLSEKERSAVSLRVVEGLPYSAGIASSDRTWLLSTARNGPHTCLALKIESASRLLGTSEICGGIELGRLNAGTARSGTSRPLLYGTLPEDVDRVRLVDVDGTETSARAIDGPGLAGRFFVVELPTADPRGVRVELLRAAGELARSPIPLLQLLTTSTAPARPGSAD